MIARRKAIIDGLYQLSSDIKKTLALEPVVKQIAASLVKETNLLLLSRGYQAATSLEGALKIKEVSYIHAEGILAGELKHGPLALIDASMPILLVMNKDRHYSVLLFLVVLFAISLFLLAIARLLLLNWMPHLVFVTVLCTTVPLYYSSFKHLPFVYCSFVLLELKE